MRGMSPWGLTCWRRCPPRTRRRGRRAAGRWGSTSGCDRGNAARCCDGSGPSMTGCPNLTYRQTEGGREGGRGRRWWQRHQEEILPTIRVHHTDHIIKASCFITMLPSHHHVQHHDCRWNDFPRGKSWDYAEVFALYQLIKSRKKLLSHPKSRHSQRGDIKKKTPRKATVM